MTGIAIYLIIGVLVAIFDLTVRRRESDKAFEEGKRVGLSPYAALLLLIFLWFPLTLLLIAIKLTKRGE